MEVSLSVKSVTLRLAIPAVVVINERRLIAPIIDIISALYDAECLPGPGTLEPEEKITSPRFFEAKQYACAAEPYLTEASVAIAVLSFRNNFIALWI